ncbi:MAG: hypothetical protein QXT31_05945 [Candidatus Bathyarchaeia archaeon]
MSQEDFFNLFVKVLQQIVEDIASLFPKIFLATITFTIMIIIIKLINKFFKAILKFTDLDEIFKKFLKFQLPFSLNRLIILLIDAGIVLIALFGIAGFILSPQQIELMKEILNYVARVASVIFVTILAFIMFNILIERMSIESRMRGYVIFILLILVTMMIVDLTAFSMATKEALVNGLSIGLGIAIGVFAIWFFFHAYLDKFLKS